MLNGYVGIVSHTGLCEIQVEGRHSMLHIQRAAGGRSSPRIGFWAILADDTARYISGLVRQGQQKEALRVLNQSAREAGHLPPINP